MRQLTHMFSLEIDTASHNDGCLHIIFTLHYRELVVVCHVPGAQAQCTESRRILGERARGRAGSTVAVCMRLGTDDKYLNFNT